MGVPAFPDGECPFPDGECPFPDGECPFPDGECPFPDGFWEPFGRFTSLHTQGVLWTTEPGIAWLAPCFT